MVGLIAILPGSGVLGALVGSARALDRQLAAAASLRSHGDFRGAIGFDGAVAARSGPLFLLGHDTIATASTGLEDDTLSWSMQLRDAGQIDQAVAVIDGLRDPHASRAVQLRADVLTRGAAQEARRGQFDRALAHVEDALMGGLPPQLDREIRALRAEYEVSAAPQLIAAGRAAEAVRRLDDVVAEGMTGTGTARSMLPDALLAAARQALAAQDPQGAATALERLTTDFAASAAAGSGRVLLAQPQPVSGTLVHRDGTPVAGRIRLSEHFIRTQGGYTSSGPFSDGATGAHGDFVLPAVPVGGPYLLEVQRDGAWTTLLDPSTGRPVDSVVVSAMNPVDLGFIVLPD